MADETTQNNGGMATADDFLKAREFEPTERLRLPKLGKDILVRRPQPLYFVLRDRLPATLAGKITGGPDANHKERAEALIEGARFMYEILRDVMVEPKVSLRPEPGAVSL